MSKPILILLFSLLGILSTHAYDFEVNGIYYNIISGTDQVAVTSGTAKYSGAVVIPSMVTYNETTYAVTTIGRGAFSNCSGLTSVTIPESVTSIGDRAFEDCWALTSVEWNAVDFQDVNNSNYRPFYGCVNITSITFGNQVEHIPSCLCYGMNKLTSVTIPESVTSIGVVAFWGCSGLTSVTIPNSVTSIAWRAFEGCSGLTSVTIPESVSFIGGWVFKDCSGLISVEWNSISCISDCYDSYYEEWDPPFWKCENITSITFGEQVENIPAYLCYNCSGLTSVTIPNSVTTIGNSAFSGCSGLTSVTIPESVTSIGDYAFEGCIGLRSVTIPESVTTIGSFAFYDCRGLISVTSLSKIPPYCTREGVFSDDVHTDEGIRDTYFQPLYVPRGSKSLYESAYEWHKFSKIQEISGVGTAMVTVHPNDATMGTVTGGGEYKEGEQAMLAAIPYQGYYFARWDDGNTNNPRMLTVSGDTTITAIFAKNGGAPDNPDIPTANENSEADNFRVYVQDRTIYLSEDWGLVQVYNMAGQCVYNGHATAIPVPHPGVYILRVADGRSRKVLVR